MIEPQAFQVDINGCWTHPDFPETDESWDEKRFSEWARQEGLESKLIFADVGEGDAIQTHWWELRKPKGEGWFVGSIHDTDEGPVCVWLRNAAAHQSGEVDHLGNY
nr:hypothetical protein [Dickeya oryzae]